MLMLRVLLLQLLLLLIAMLPQGRCQIQKKIENPVSCYECNIYRTETGNRVQCQEYTEDPETKAKNWIVVPISSGKIPITEKKCFACGTFITWSQNHHRKPRGGDESQVTVVLSRFCLEEELERQFKNGGCVDNVGSQTYMRRCFCTSDNCNNYDSLDMMKFGP